MTTHKTYRIATLTDGSFVMYPVWKDVSQGLLYWDDFEGTDHGFRCFCGEPIEGFADAFAMAREEI